MSQVGESKLTTAQKCRIERNRAKAKLLLQAKLVPYAASKKNTGVGEDGGKETPVIKVQGTKYIDSGGGFLLEQPVIPAITVASSRPTGEDSPATAVDEAIIIPITFEECLDCSDHFADSFLFDNFGYSVCDKCRDADGRHALITRTEAKGEYLLKDCDFDKREPILRYISRKNPHNVRWGEMKLYLHMQIQERAMQVWGSEEELMRQHENRVDKREVSKVRKYNKNMKELRMQVRSSLYTKETKSTHVHEFGSDTYNEEEDNYTHSCVQCGYDETYEKM